MPSPFLDLGAIGGGLLFGGLYLAAADKQIHGRPLMWTTSVGIAAGLTTAWLATASMPADRPEQTPEGSNVAW